MSFYFNCFFHYLDLDFGLFLYHYDTVFFPFSPPPFPLSLFLLSFFLHYFGLGVILHLPHPPLSHLSCTQARPPPPSICHNVINFPEVWLLAIYFFIYYHLYGLVGWYGVGRLGVVIGAGIFIIIVSVFYNTFVILGEWKNRVPFTFSCLISVLIKRYLLHIFYLYITRIFLFFSFGILLNLPPP